MEEAPGDSGGPPNGDLSGESSPPPSSGEALCTTRGRGVSQSVCVCVCVSVCVCLCVRLCLLWEHLQDCLLWGPTTDPSFDTGAG